MKFQIKMFTYRPSEKPFKKIGVTIFYLKLNK